MMQPRAQRSVKNPELEFSSISGGTYKGVPTKDLRFLLDKLSNSRGSSELPVNDESLSSITALQSPKSIYTEEVNCGFSLTILI
jgi:hypothetical protein